MQSRSFLLLKPTRDLLHLLALGCAVFSAASHPLTAAAVDIGGYVIRQSNSTYALTLPSTNVGAGGYVVIGRNASQSQFESKWGVTLGTNVAYINAANNFPRIDGAERFVLFNAGGTNLDGVTAAIDPVNRSIQRKNTSYPAGSSTSWNSVVYSSATPGSGAAGNGATGLRISEFADHSQFSYEFVELYYDAATTNTPPVLWPLENKVATLSNTVQFAVNATVTDGDPVTLSASNLPAGAVFSATNENGWFNWPIAQPTGVYTVRFYAVDHDGSDIKSVTIGVYPPPNVSFLLSEYTCDEGVGTQQVQVVLTRPADATVRVALVSGGTATLGTNQDFYLVSTTVVFSAGGPTQMNCSVVVVNDSLTESIETICLALTNAAGCVITPPATHTLSIRDNDAITIMTANLVSGYPAVYRDPGFRILEGLKPDICALQEWSVTNSGGIREFVDLHFGSNYYYYIEPQASNFFPQPNGVVSRWPILAAGEWSDTFTINRDFVWATIDIPGDRNLHIVVVHFYYSGGEADREAEARLLTNYIATAGFPANDYLVIAGDLNTVSEGEPCLAVLTNVVTDARRPVDQNANYYTSRNRDQRFDYVLPKRNLNSNHYTTVISGSNFTEGLVFDTRLWTNTPPPTPVLVTDSAATGMAHMAVMKSFSIGRTPPSLVPIGIKNVLAGDTLQFSVIAEPTDGDTVTLTASNLPPGATFGATNQYGTFTWTGAAPVGIYTSIFYAADSDGAEHEDVVIKVLVDGTPWINEIHYDNASTDTNEGVEIAGPAGLDLAFYWVYAYNGEDGTIYYSNNLTGYIDDEGCGYGAVWVPINGLQQGPDAVALVRQNGTTNVVDFPSYEGVVVAVEGPAIEMTSTDIIVDEDGTETDMSLQLIGIGTNANQFSWAGPTNAASRGSLNSRQTLYPCGTAAEQPPALNYIGNRTTIRSNALNFVVTAVDYNGDPITLSASNVPIGAVFSPTNSSGTFYWAVPSPTGVYACTFYATDNDGTDSETIQITVGSGVEKPVLASIGNKSVIQSQTLAFAVSATDAENDPITLSVSNAPAGAVFSSTNGNGWFSWTNCTPITVVTCRFYAVDDDGYDYETIKITISAPTNLPVLQTIGSRWVTCSNTLTFGVSASDLDGDPITLSASNLPPGATFTPSGSTGTFEWISAAPVGIYTSLFYAVDNDGADWESVQIQVLVNGAIWINEIHYDNIGTDTNEGVEVAGTAGTDLRFFSLVAYNQPDGLAYATTNLSGFIDDEGCGYGAVWVAIPGLQQGPDGVALVNNGSNLIEFLSYEGAFVASNGPAAGSISYDIKVKEDAAPTNCSLQLTGVGVAEWQFRWAGATNQASRGDLNALQEIYPCGAATNQPPLLYRIGNRAIDQNTTLMFNIAATDYNGSAVTLSISNSPPGAVLGATNELGTFTWTNAAPAGVYTTTFYAVDMDGSDSETIYITVNNTATNPPVVAAISDKTATLGNTIQFLVSATEVDGDEVTLTVSNPPPGSVFYATNATKSGSFVWANVSPVGVYTSYFYAADKDGADSEYVLFTITPPAESAGDLLARYDFDDGAGGFTNTPDATHSNLTATSYTSGRGVYTDAAGNPGRAISDTYWLAGTNYYHFSITIAPGYQASVTGMVLNSYRSSTGPTNWFLRYSGDGFAASVANGSQLTASVWGTNTAAINLNGLTGTVTFRIYGTNAASTAGTWRNDNVQFYGLVTAIAGNDDDGDGIPNDWELEYFGGPTNASPNVDSDGDGLPNLGEYIAHSIPTNSLSAFWANAVRVALSNRVEFGTAYTDRFYSIYYKTNLGLPEWTTLQTNIPGSGGLLYVTVTNEPTPVYYRIRVSLP